MSGKAMTVILLLCAFGVWQHFHHRPADTFANWTPVQPHYRGKVVVYGRDTCGYTQQTLAFLRANSVPTAYRNLDEPGVSDEFAARFDHTNLTGSRDRYRLPVVEIAGHASERPDPSELLDDYRISQRIATSPNTVTNNN